VLAKQFERVVPLVAKKARISHSMHSGSMARATSTLPMSAVSQPNWSRMPRTVCVAASSLPQINIVGLPPGSSGLTMSEFPTELKIRRTRKTLRVERDGVLDGKH
jgi:hypothetical protein